MRQAEARAAVAGIPNVRVYSIVGNELLAAGLNAIHTVGRASLVEPRLVVLELTPTDPMAAAAPPIGLVGKGIVYDTGGLNLKGCAPLIRRLPLCTCVCACACVWARAYAC